MGLYMDVQSHGFYEGLCWVFFVPLRMSSSATMIMKSLRPREEPSLTTTP